MIEELHRVEKEGCRLEAAQLDDAEDLKHLAAAIAVVAVGMLQMRDMAEAAIAPSARPVAAPSAAPAAGGLLAPADDPAVLRRFAPNVFTRVVAALTKVNPATLTPRQFCGRSPNAVVGWAARATAAPAGNGVARLARNPTHRPGSRTTRDSVKRCV